MDEADKVIPDYAVQSLESSARADANQTPSISYAEPTSNNGTSTMTPEQIAQKEADLLARETALQAQTASFSEREASISAAEKATQMALDAIQLLGGNGYINDYPTGRLLRDAKLYEIGAGTSEIRRMLIGRELFAKTA